MPKPTELNDDTSSQVSEGEEENLEESQQSESQTSDATPSAPSSEPKSEPLFSDPFLEQLGPKGVEKLLRETQKKLTQKNTAPAPPQNNDNGRQGGAPENTEISDQEFWKNPTKVIRHMLDQTVDPIQRNIESDRTELAFQRARDSFPHFALFENTIRQNLAEQNIPVNDDTLARSYYLVKGWYVENAADPNLDMGGKKEPATSNTPPPQHKASSTPLPNAGGSQKKTLRKLNEEEKRLARVWKMTDEEFLRHMEDEPMIMGGSNE